MTATQETGAVAATLVQVLADALGRGLPEPEHITISPHCHPSTDPEVDAIGLGFGGGGKLAAVRAWACEFRGSAELCPASAYPPREAWFKAYFTHSGVRFCAYAHCHINEAETA